MSENEIPSNAELNLDALDEVAGGAGRADSVVIEGQVVEALPNAMFQVQLDDGKTVLCHVSGQLRTSFVRILPGDRVRVEMNPGDSSRGRIIWRYK